MSEIYLLGTVFLVAAVLALMLRKVHQPLVVSYIAAGAVLSFLGVVKSEQLSFIRFLPEIGLAFLLFLVGMELDLREIKSLGKNVFVAALLQVVLAAAFLFVFWHSLPPPLSTPVLLGVAFSLSSTVLVVKLLLESKDLGSLHGKLAIGVLLTEDILAILVMMLLTTLGQGGGLSVLLVLVTVAKGTILISAALVLGRKFLPKILEITADNSELLLLLSITWCLVFVCVSLMLGFSSGIGAFLAGISLAQSVYRLQISGKMKPLRDFFIMLFFVDVGLTVFPVSKGFIWIVPLVLVTYSVVVKPVLFFLIFSALRFRAHSAFRTAILLSSISEFSLIILFLAKNNGLIGPDLASSLVLATVLSYVASSFLITHQRGIYGVMGPVLKNFERQKTLGFDFLQSDSREYKDHVVLVGCHRSGEIILKNLRKIFGDNLMVVDFNPEVVLALKDQGVACVYGDATDPEIVSKLNFKQAKLVVSTVRDLRDNLALLDHLEKVKSKAVVILTAADVKEAVTLYERGAHHVSMPVVLEGIMISRLIGDYQGDLSKLAGEREKKLGELKNGLYSQK